MKSNKFIIWCVIAAISGFLALSYEMIWFRVYLYSESGSAQSFGKLIGFYLLGIAFGSYFSRKFCFKEDSEKFNLGKKYLILVLILTSVISFLVVPVGLIMATNFEYWYLLFLICLATFFMGMTFPMITHYGINGNINVGEKISYFYLSNIIGSSLGSLITGIVLMDFFSSEEISIIILSLNTLLLLGIGFLLLENNWLIWNALFVSLFFIFSWAFSSDIFYEMYSKLSFKKDFSESNKFEYVVENKHGVITVTKDGIIYGGGIYDGRFNLNLMDDQNIIRRAFAFGGIHKNPKRILLIGLGSGSWSQVVVNHPDVEEVICVEINDGYKELLKHYSTVKSLEFNPKFKLIIDDGRRWLNKNPDEKFDVIIANTTYHYRLMATNLLSVEFMQIIRSHLNQNGIYQYNTTYSERAFLTGAKNFKYAFSYHNNLICSDYPIKLDKELWKQNLLRWKIDGKNVVDTLSIERKLKLTEIINTFDNDINSRENLIKKFGHLKEITDNNMGTEWEWRN